MFFKLFFKGIWINACWSQHLGGGFAIMKGLVALWTTIFLMYETKVDVFKFSLGYVD